MLTIEIDESRINTDRIWHIQYQHEQRNNCDNCVCAFYQKIHKGLINQGMEYFAKGGIVTIDIGLNHHGEVRSFHNYIIFQGKNISQSVICYLDEENFAIVIYKIACTMVDEQKNCFVEPTTTIISSIKRQDRSKQK